jgi:predicted PurR-regulated permease PerM
MRTRPSPISPAAALNGIWALLLLAFVVAALYFGRTVFVPIALSTLIAFLLSRLVARLERWIGRIAAILVTVTVMFSIFATASWVIGRQLIDLADKLPSYQANITSKIRSLKFPAAGPLARVSSSVNTLQKELVALSPAPRTGQAPADYSTRTASPIATPIPDKIIEGRNAVPQLLQETITAILSPLGTAALVLLLVIFMLLKREDLRGRMIRLIGQGRIGATTRAMEDAGYRVSRYKQLAHTARHDCSLRRFGSNGVELCRTMALRSAYRRVACCLDHFGDVLDLVVGPRRPGTLYSHDGVW